MIYSKLLAGCVLALGLTVAATSALASSQKDGWFACNPWPTAKAWPSKSHCATWTKTAAGRMRAVCDPATMSDRAMREHCADLAASFAPRAASPSA